MRKFLAFAAFLLLASPAAAQPSVAVLAPTPASLSVTTASARVAFPSSIANFPVVTVVNVGANEAFIQIGTSSVTANTTSNYLVSILPGASRSIYAAVKDSTGAQVNTNLAAITASSTATLRITQSTGAPTMGPAGAGTYNITTATITNANVGITDTAATPIDPATSEGQTTTNAALGTPSDTPWLGIGNGTIIAILKAIAVNTTPP